MKNRLKKFLSVALVVVMTLASVVITDIQPVHAASGAITEAKGWFETAYVKWTPVSGATGYNVYVKAASATDAAYVQLDDELIRKYPSYMRADALGLRAGDYVMKVVPVVNGKENASAAIVSNTMTVSAYDRSGFTFSSNSPAKNGVGAYNNDGTLKSGASVLYVTEANKNTVKMKIGNTEYTGVAAITQAIKTKNHCQPVAIRIIGQVTQTIYLANQIRCCNLNICGGIDTRVNNLKVIIACQLFVFFDGAAGICLTCGIKDADLLCIRKHRTDHFQLFLHRKDIRRSCDISNAGTIFVCQAGRNRIRHCSINNRNVRIHGRVVCAGCTRCCNCTDQIILCRYKAVSNRACRTGIGLCMLIIHRQVFAFLNAFFF